MAVSNEMGNAIRMAKKVTHNEPTINGRKPNSPFIGFHSLEVIRLTKERPSSTGADLR